MGVLMPSVDRVGRAFPLTIVVPVDPAAATARGHMRLREGFEALETLALDALEYTMTQDALKQRLCELSGSLLLLSAAPAPSVPEAFDIDGARCYWSALLDGRTEFFATCDLPAASRMVAMFDLSDPSWEQEAAE